MKRLLMAALVAALSALPAQAQFQQPYAGSVQRTTNGKMSDVVSVLDWIPQSLHAGIKAATNTTDLATYFSSAQTNAPAGATILIPPGTYKLDTSVSFSGRRVLADGAIFTGSGASGLGFPYWDPGQTTPVAGTSQAVDWVWGTAGDQSFCNAANQWSSKVWSGVCIAKSFNSGFTGPSIGPINTLFLYGANTGSPYDVVVNMLFGDARADNSAVFAANEVLTSPAGLSNVKVLGRETDLQVDAGTTVGSGSGAWAVNAYNHEYNFILLSGSPDGVGKFTNGLVIGGISAAGAALSPSAGETMGSLVNCGSATFNEACIVRTLDKSVNLAAPSTPSAGNVYVWTDSTDKRLHDKNDAGTIGTTVVADTGTSNNFLTAISAAGVISKARPTCANLSDAAASCATDATNASNISSGTLAAARGGFPQSAWSTFVYTANTDFTCQSGTMTSGAATAHYQQVGKTIHIQIEWSITTNNTCASGLTFTLPVTARSNKGSLPGFESGITGGSTQGRFASTSSLSVFTYSGSYPGGSGASGVISGVYEAN